MTAVLHTPRLCLRPCTPDDVDPLHALLIDPGVRRYLCDGRVVPRETAAAFVADSVTSFAEHGLGLWLLGTAEDHPIGFCGFRLSGEVPELLYGLSPVWWGRGLAVEAARAVLHYAFHERGVARVVAGTDTPNVTSLRVLEQLGMRPTHREPGAFGEILWFEWRRG